MPACKFTDAHCERVLRVLRALPSEPRHFSVPLAGRMLNDTAKVRFRVCTTEIKETPEDWGDTGWNNTFRFTDAGGW